jgi:alkylation response protein AidB-like acyl-CoA dehydrogenase
MDLELSDEQRMLVEQVRRFVRREVEPLEADMDPDASELPADDHERLVGITTGMGLYHMDVPEEFGGAGLDVMTRTLLAMEMSQHRAGLYAPCYGTFGGMGLAQLYDANDDQKDRYLYPALRGEKRGFFGLTEPSGGSDPARAIQTRAVQDGDDWVINGQKIFISGADRADFGLVFARTSPEKGRAGVTCFLVDTDMPGFHVRRIVHTLRSTNYATELQFENLRVPAENVLGQVDGGFAIANERLTRNRIPYAASCLGVAMRAQEMAIEYVKIRETFGDLLATRQTIQNMIIDNEMDIQTARWLTLFAAHKADQGEPFRTEAAMAKIAATEAGGRVVDRVMQIHGGYGVTKEFPFERWYREMRIRRIGEGPNEVQRLIIARDLIGGSFH